MTRTLAQLMDAIAAIGSELGELQWDDTTCLDQRAIAAAGAHCEGARQILQSLLARWKAAEALVEVLVGPHGERLFSPCPCRRFEVAPFRRPLDTLPAASAANDGGAE